MCTKNKYFCSQLPQTNKKTLQLHSKSSLISTLRRKSVLRRESERNAQNRFSALGELSADATALLLKKKITREISIRRSLDFHLEIDLQTVGPVIRLKCETFCWKTTQKKIVDSGAFVLFFRCLRPLQQLINNNYIFINKQPNSPTLSGRPAAFAAGRLPGREDLPERDGAGRGLPHPRRRRLRHPAVPHAVPQRHALLQQGE